MMVRNPLRRRSTPDLTTRARTRACVSHALASNAGAPPSRSTTVAQSRLESDTRVVRRLNHKSILPGKHLKLARMAVGSGRRAAVVVARHGLQS